MSEDASSVPEKERVRRKSVFQFLSSLVDVVKNNCQEFTNKR